MVFYTLKNLVTILLYLRTLIYAVFFAQATFEHVQKVPKKILHRNFVCTYKKGVFAK